MKEWKHQLVIVGNEPDGTERTYYTYDTITNAKNEFERLYPTAEIKSLATSD